MTNGRTNKNYIALACCILRLIREEYEQTLLKIQQNDFLTTSDRMRTYAQLRAQERNLMSDYVQCLTMERFNAEQYINTMRKAYGIKERKFND